MDYLIYTPAEQLTVAADFLRSAEAAHYRLSLLPAADPTRDARVADAEAEVTKRQDEYKAIKAAAAAQQGVGTPRDIPTGPPAKE